MIISPTKWGELAAIEGAISELARAHGLRRSRYRGFAKVELQNLFIATTCNVKRWLQAIPAAIESSLQFLFRTNLLFGLRRLLRATPVELEFVWASSQDVLPKSGKDTPLKRERAIVVRHTPTRSRRHELLA